MTPPERALAPSQVAPTLGDLTEDYDRQVRTRGRLRADLWLLQESLSVAHAYRARELQERRSSRRLVAGRAWLDDARFALRRIRKRPGASAVSIVTLACAIGAGAVTWSLLSALLLAPLPVAEPDRLVSVDFEYPRYQNIPSSRSPSHVYPVYLAIRNSALFEGLAAGGINELLVQETGGAVARPRPVHFASFDYFSTLGVRMQLGRTFTVSNDRRGAPLIAVISDRYWRSAWNADPAIGRIEPVRECGGATVRGCSAACRVLRVRRSGAQGAAVWCTIAPYPAPRTPAPAHRTSAPPHLRTPHR